MYSAATTPVNKNIVNRGDQQIWNRAFKNDFELQSHNVVLKLEDYEFHNYSTNPEFDYHFEPTTLRSIFERTFGKNMDDIYRQVLKSRQTDPNSLLRPGVITQTQKNYINMGFFNLHLKVFDKKEAQLQGFSILSIVKMVEAINRRTIFCEDRRLDTYNHIRIDDYISKKGFDNEQYTILIKMLKSIVDENIQSYRPDSKKIVMQSGFDCIIDEQGSGVRAMICLAADILSANTNNLVIIDEPELGLHPKAKQVFLEFLIDQTEDKQIFVATHDPTFLNPILLKLHRKDVKPTLLLYSSIKGDFIKASLDHSIEVAGSFAGYLPHTTSYKELHIYTEGRTDVQNIKEFLYKYLWHKDVWTSLEDRISIFHLQGDFGKHILSTLPPHPFKKIIILDGDKSKKLEEMFGSPRQKIEEEYPVIFCGIDHLEPGAEGDELFEQTKQNIQKHFPTGEKALIILLEKECIEKYLDPPPTRKEIGPQIAHKMTIDKIDREFIILFDFLSRVLLQKESTQ
jgi:AAA15 family ATPase/GTPase